MLISCFSRPGFPFYTPSHPPLSPHGFYPPINPLGRPFLLWIARVSLRNKLPQFFYTIGWMGKQDSIKQYNSIRTRIKNLKMLVTFTSLSSISNQQMHGWLLSCSDRRANDAAMPDGWNTFSRDSFYVSFPKTVVKCNAFFLPRNILGKFAKLPKLQIDPNSSELIWKHLPGANNWCVMEKVNFKEFM